MGGAIQEQSVGCATPAHASHASSCAPSLTTDNAHLGSLVGAFGLRRTLGMAAGVRGSWHVVNPPGIMARPESDRYNPVWTFWFETSVRHPP